MKSIQSKPLLFQGAPQSFLIELLTKWITEWPTKNRPTQPSVKILCAALRSSLVGLGELANQVEIEMKDSITELGKNLRDTNAVRLFKLVQSHVCMEVV